MKKTFLFSAIAVLLAVGGATASTAFANEYFPAGVQCTGPSSEIPPCTPGELALCKNGSGIQYYYTPDEGVNCYVLRKNTNNP